MIHHITAICANAQATHDYYTKALGLRLIKTTVNFDDPTTYHLYFADRTGRPGTLWTFFPWKDMPRAHLGAGMVSIVMFSAPTGSLPYWEDRMHTYGPVERTDRDGLASIRFNDPDGIILEIVEHGAPGDWAGSDILAEHAISAFFGARILTSSPDATAQVLSKLSYTEKAREEGIILLESSARIASRIELEAGTTPGRYGTGSVHHIAFRARDDAHEKALMHEFSDYSPSPQISRIYFTSVYFREPGGTLFEIATDEPGPLVDEDVETVGTRLMLPPWYEPYREQIEAALPFLTR